MAARAQAQQSATGHSRPCARRDFPHPKGWRRDNGRRNGDRTSRVPRHRDQRATAQSRVGRRQTHRRDAATRHVRGLARPVRRAAGVRHRGDHQSGRTESDHRRQPRQLSAAMQTEPSASIFAERYARGEAQVVWTTLVADLETPVSAFLKIAGGRPMSFLLESVEGGAVRGRYSVIGLDPDLVWRANGTEAEVNRVARSKPDAFTRCNEPPIAALRALIAESRIELPENLPPMAAGVFGYLGYDTVRLLEDLPAPN